MTRRTTVTCTFLAVILTANAFDQQAQQSAKTGENTVKVDANSKEPFTVELLKTVYSFENDGKGYRETTLRVHLQSESAVRDFGLLVYPYASSFESIERLKIKVNKPDGTSVETPESEIQDLDSAVSREAPMYTDGREKHVAVRSLTVGDTLEANVRWTVHDPIAPGNFWLDHSYFKAGTCLKEILEVNVPGNQKLNLRATKTQPAVRVEGQRRIYTFETSYAKPKEDSKIPDWEKTYYGLDPPDVQFSSFSDWPAVADWFAGLIGTKAAVTHEIKAKAEELIKGKGTEQEKIQAIYDFVSTRFRYIGIDLGMGRYSPHTAADVLTNRYGDCKDKHTLFAALLEAVGIHAYPVLISSKYKIDPTIPTPSLFDHVITAIALADKVQFVDATPEVAPFGLLLRQLRGREALLASRPGKLVKTPRELGVPNYEVFSVEGSLDKDGTFDAKMSLEEEGEDAVTLRTVYRATPQNRWQELTQALVSRLGFGGTVSEVDVTQPENTAQPFRMTCSYHRTDYSEWKNGRITLPHPPLFLRELTDEQKLSKDSLPVGTPGEVKYVAKIKFPSGFSPRPPENTERNLPFATFSTKYSVEKDVLTGTFLFKILAEDIPGEERASFAKFAKTMEEAQNSYVYVNGQIFNEKALSAMHLFAGVPDIPKLESALAQDPDNSFLLEALTNTYINEGRAKDAVTLLQKKIKENPDVPDHLRLALGLAELKVSDPEKAMTEFKAVLTQTAEPEQLNNVAYSLAEANTHLPEALDYSSRAAKSVEGEAAEISLGDADEGDYQRMLSLAAYWDTLGWVKFKMGDTESAERFLKAAWQLNQSAVVGEHLVEVYEKLGQKANAAAICNMAISTVMPTSGKQAGENLTQEMNRLRPFVKRIPGMKNSGSPRYVDGAFALSDMRLFEVPFRAKLAGNSAAAHFLILLTNGPKVEDVKFVSGSEELSGAANAIRAVRFPHTFPDENETRILRRATFTCTVYTNKCNLILMPIAEAAAAKRNFVVPN